jgi:hypothetical protein
VDELWKDEKLRKGWKVGRLEDGRSEEGAGGIYI